MIACIVGIRYFERHGTTTPATIADNAIKQKKKKYLQINKKSHCDLD